jgi:hypothetical protein
MRTSICSDLHFGEVNHSAVERYLEHVKSVQPDKIIIAGDLLDAARLGSFDKVPGFGDTFQDEISYARLFLRKLREVCPKSIIILLEANHELRFKILIWKNVEEMSGLSGFSIPELLGLEELKIDWVPMQDGAARFVDTFVEDQGFLIGHFNTVKKGAGNTVRGLMQKYGTNIIQAHVHRLAQIYQRVMNKQLIGIECGCLCTLNPKWVKYPDWQNGYVDIIDGIPDLQRL